MAPLQIHATKPRLMSVPRATSILYMPQPRLGPRVTVRDDKPF